MKKIFTLLLCLSSMFCAAQNIQFSTSPEEDGETLMKITTQFDSINTMYGQQYNDSELLAKYLAHIDKAKSIYDASSISDSSMKQYVESALTYLYCHCLSYYTNYADREKLSDEQYAKLLDREYRVCTHVLDQMTSRKDLFQEHPIWNEALTIATNVMGMKIVNQQDTTAELIDKVITAFEFLLPQFNSSEKLYALDTYIRTLLIEGDSEKAFLLIEKGYRIDSDHKDFVALVARDDYKNWLANRRVNSQTFLDKRVKELRTQFIGEHAANTRTTHFRTKTQEQALKTPSSDAKWTLLPVKQYIKKYGDSSLNQILIENKSRGIQDEIVILVYDGNYVCPNFNFDYLHNDVDNPYKVQATDNYAIVAVVKGDLIVTASSPSDEYYSNNTATISVEGDLYANQLIDINALLCVKGNIYVDELVKITLDHIVCKNLECGVLLSEQNEYSYPVDEEPQKPLIKEYFGSLLDKSSDCDVSNTEKIKLIYELLQAGLLSPIAAEICGIKYSDSYAKYLYPESSDPYQYSY